MGIICEQCKTWLDVERKFETLQEATEHLVNAHGNRVVLMLMAREALFPGHLQGIVQNLLRARKDNEHVVEVQFNAETVEQGPPGPLR